MTHVPIVNLLQSRYLILFDYEKIAVQQLQTFLVTFYTAEDQYSIAHYRKQIH